MVQTPTVVGSYSSPFRTKQTLSVGLAGGHGGTVSERVQIKVTAWAAFSSKSSQLLNL